MLNRSARHGVGRRRLNALCWSVVACVGLMGCSRSGGTDPTAGNRGANTAAGTGGAPTATVTGMTPMASCATDNRFCSAASNPIVSTAGVAAPTISQSCGSALTLQPTPVNIMVAVDGDGSSSAHWPAIKSAVRSLRENNPAASFGMHLFWTDRIDVFAGEENTNGSNNPCKLAHDQLLELGPHDATALESFIGEAPPGPPAFIEGAGTVSLIESLNYYVKNPQYLSDPNATNYLVVFTPGFDTCFGSFFTAADDKLVAFQKVAIELAKRNIRVIPVGLFADPSGAMPPPNYSALKTVLDSGGSGLSEVPTINDPQKLLATVGKTTNNCRYVVADPANPSATINPFELKLSINGIDVVRDRRQLDGWDVVLGASSQLEFFGPACEAVRTGQVPQVGMTCAQDICGTAVVTAETKQRVVLMLLDGSASRSDCVDGSMECIEGLGSVGGGSYWVEVQRAVSAALISPVNDEVAFGMQFFPAKTAQFLTCEVATEPEFPPAQGAQIGILKAVLEKLPLGLSPVVGVMESVAAAPGLLADPNVVAAVILLSDGGDNCAMVPQAEVVARLDAATQKLFDLGVKTYAIRYGSAAGETPEQRAQLTTIVTRGGTATTGGAAPYVDAKSAADLNAALATISDTLASCSFALDTMSQAVDKERTNLYLNGEQVGFDQTGSKQAGWGWVDPERTTIELYGESCTAFKTNRRTRIAVEFGCEQVVIAPD